MTQDEIERRHDEGEDENEDDEKPNKQTAFRRIFTRHVLGDIEAQKPKRVQRSDLIRRLSFSHLTAMRGEFISSHFPQSMAHLYPSPGPTPTNPQDPSPNKRRARQCLPRSHVHLPLPRWCVYVTHMPRLHLIPPDVHAGTVISVHPTPSRVHSRHHRAAAPVRLGPADVGRRVDLDGESARFR